MQRSTPAGEREGGPPVAFQWRKRRLEISQRERLRNVPPLMPIITLCLCIILGTIKQS